jgi:hypothetical protein
MIVACQWKRSSPTGPALQVGWRQAWGAGRCGERRVRGRAQRGERTSMLACSPQFGARLHREPTARLRGEGVREPRQGRTVPRGRPTSGLHRPTSAPAVGWWIALEVLQLCTSEERCGRAADQCMARRMPPVMYPSRTRCSLSSPFMILLEAMVTLLRGRCCRPVLLFFLGPRKRGVTRDSRTRGT